MKEFKTCKELSWYYHAKLCKGDVAAEYLMKQCYLEKDVNAWLERIGEPYRVKNPEEAVKPK